MLTKSLLVACPFLLLSACTIKSDGLTDTVGTSSATEASATEASATEGHSSDPMTDSATEGMTSVSSETAATTTPVPGDDPANDNCVPMRAAEEPWPGTTGGEGGGSTGGWTDTDNSDTDDTDDTGGECPPLPPQKPAPEDFNCVCDVKGEHRPCTGADEQPGTRFCDGASWGACIAAPQCIPGTYEVCFFCDPEFGTTFAFCELNGGDPAFDFNTDACNTPLVMSFDGRQVEYTSTHAEFAMTASDGCGARDWPTAATPWLAIDLDKNGNIDGGHELFGSGTRMAGIGRPGNGFVALAALDSNRDGQISAADERFAELVVWADADADRRSTLWELQPIASHGVISIDLHYAMPASRCDARGNCEVERASFVFAGPDGARSSGEVVDVRLGCQ
ncbi:MAG: calcium-binding protein [Nannocystis sp.]|nr:calcium-binding protein [Nannocystis sp.]MBA3547793.1 calcium-binding protein [Nannocystis sp.]